MPPPKPPLNPTSDSTSAPSTPAKRHSPNPKHARPSTPANRKSADPVGTPTPKSAPAAAAPVGASTPQRKKQEPTLLGDFLLGRPSPARVAAQRAAQTQLQQRAQQRAQQQQEREKRRKSMAAADAAGVREELRQEMRAAAVRGPQQPGNVQARVRAWQKANAAALRTAPADAKDPAEDAASEPTDVLDQFDKDSVTEEDRLRIGMRQKATPRRRKPRRKSAEKTDTPKEAEPNQDPNPDPNRQADDSTRREATNSPRPHTPPKKRIVSDDNWMKRRKGRSPPRTYPAKPKPKPENISTQHSNAMPLPKDFLARGSRNPSVQNKIKDWAQRVEIPDSPSPSRLGQYYTMSESGLTADEDTSNVHSPSVHTPSFNSQANEASRRQEKKHTGGDPGSSEPQLKPRKSRAKTESDGSSRAKPTSSDNSLDDGIRVRPMEPTETTISTALDDDGIRVRPIETTTPQDDGIRVRSVSVEHDPTRSGSGTRAGAPTNNYKPAYVADEDSCEVETPTRTRDTRRVRTRARRRTVTPTATTQAEKPTGPRPRGDRGPSYGTQPDVLNYEARRTPPTASGSNSLGEIPFGNSAFSELDLPLGADARNSTRRPGARRNPSLKAVPKVFKKVVNEGMKIMHHDKAEAARPATNQPPNIENWLSNTVDPFVESQKSESSSPPHSGKEQAKEASAQQSTSPEPQPGGSHQEPKAREIHGRLPKSSSTDRVASAPPPMTTSNPPVDPASDWEDVDPKHDRPNTAPKAPPTKDSPTAMPALKRSRATRSSSSPYKPTQKKPFRQQLKEVFRGESGGHQLPPAVYPSYQEQQAQEDHYRDEDDSYHDSPDRYHDKDGRNHSDSKRLPSGSNKSFSSHEPTTTESTVDSTSTLSSLAPPRRKPPTNGHHELSTIVSGDSSSTQQYDTISTVSQTTVTQSTTYTEPSDLSRQRSRKSGLKRRLTKHSDLVSVLSLTREDAGRSGPNRVKSLREKRTLRRKTSKLDGATANDLLEEFADDEYFYQKELKTVVDGAIPVLLTQVVNKDGSPSRDLFGRNAPAQKVEKMAKAVVNMGVALEKLKDAHKRIPLSDTRLLLASLETIHPLYDKYLDSWRLGFENLVVNLAPVCDRLDDDDSLVNAMPQNEDGDVLDHNGERVDVAHLLKRPLARIKWIVKFLRGAYLLLGSEEARLLLPHFERLQDKTHQRYREEKARRTDEDASNTDTSRTKDLRTLSPVGPVPIDPSRQVNAKDVFKLELSHSNGQRLKCNAELIFRDNLNAPADKGDILVREMGPFGRSWLLFPPIPKQQAYARVSESEGGLAVMVRGTHNRKEWCELIKLSAQDEEQIEDWVEILGTERAPSTSPQTTPRQPSNELPTPIKTERDERQSPAGEWKPSRQSTPSIEVDMKDANAATDRPYERVLTTPTTPAPASPKTPENDTTPSPDRTPTQKNYRSLSKDHPLPPPPTEKRDEPKQEERVGDGDRTPPAKAKDGKDGPYREDGAPPPPIHRTTIAPKKATNLAPVDLGLPPRLRRRTSSPLKHEYHPSDVSSSGSSDLSSDSDLDSDSSSSDESDDFDGRDEHVSETKDEVDTPQSVSVKEGDITPTPSIVSDDSLTPSKSASQVGVSKARDSPEYTVRSFASVSYWSDRTNNWKNISPDACSITVTPGLLEVSSMNAGRSDELTGGKDADSPTTLAADGNGDTSRPPLIALDLTPFVAIRLSTVIDVEIRGSPISAGSLQGRVKSSTFRFRAPSKIECRHLFDVACHSRENNTKFKALQEEARINAFGQQQQQHVQPGQPAGDGGDEDAQQRRRSWFGRKNSYRASARAPSISHGSSSGMSASSFLKRLTAGGNPSFDIGKSTLDKQSSRPNSVAGVPAASLYTSSGASSSDRSRSTFPQLPSISLTGSTDRNQPLGTTDLKIRLHLLVRHHKWADYGNCTLDIARPDPGSPPHAQTQQPRSYHGGGKRIVVRSVPKKAGAQPTTFVDLTVGSSCFSTLGNTGIVLSIWEEVRDADGNLGGVPSLGGVSGGLTRWCLQCSNVGQCVWVMSLVTQEGYVD